MRSWLLAALLSLAPPLAWSASELPSDNQVMALPDGLLARVEAAGILALPAGKPQVDGLIAYLFDSAGLGLVYQEEATRSVADAIATGEVNCLSFTMLYLALARALGIDATAQMAESTLSWRQDGSTIFRGNHVNVLVRSGRESLLVDIRREAVVLRRPASPISDRRLLAHYHNNLAMIGMASGDLAGARVHMQQALLLAPEFASHWSNSGVLHGRAGNAAQAARDHRHALELDPENMIALSNLLGLAQREGDAELQAQYRRRLERLQERDPFHHFMLARELEQAGDRQRAIIHYRRAADMQRNEPRLHAALADAYTAAGEHRRARRALKRAWMTSSGNAREHYRALLDRLD